MKRKIDSSGNTQAKFIILPTAHRRQIERGIRETARERELSVFKIDEPCSSLGELRLGVAGETFDASEPYDLFLIWPGPNISLYGNALDRDAASRVAREMSELIVYTQDLGGLIFEDSALNPIPVELAKWVGDIPPRSGMASEPLLQSDPANIALNLYSRVNEIGDSADWSPDLFRIDPRSTKLDGGAVSVDLTGPPRRLVQGPFLFLTPGEWQIRAKFSLDAAAAKSTLRFEWGMPGVFSTLETVAGRRGFYEAVLSRSWEWGAAGEFIIELLESSIAGRLDFLGATVTRIR